VVSGAAAAELVHRVLVDLGINHCICSSYSNDVNFYKYRVIIFCRYTREQLPILLDYLFAELHSNEVMLALSKKIGRGRKRGIFLVYPMNSTKPCLNFSNSVKATILMRMQSRKTG
jgi:hypothetical protein